MIINFIKAVLLWVGGIFFGIASLAYIKSGIVTSACFFALMFIFLLPLVKLISFGGKELTGKQKFIVCFLLLMAAFKFTPEPTKQNKSVEQPSPTPTTVLPTVIPTLVPTITPTVNPNSVKVTKVIDGDTVMVDIGGTVETIRLIGVDTPETVDPRKPVQCFGKEASDNTKQLVDGKTITLEPDLTQGDKDKYNRLLRYVYLEDGILLNKKIIEDGFGFEYTYNTPYKYQTEFKQAQKQAQIDNRGLWDDNSCPVATSVLTAKPVVKPTRTPEVVAPSSTTYSAPVQSANSSEGWSCNCSKTCTQISSCSEAYFQLNQCGCSVRDADGDGVPCESLCN